MARAAGSRRLEPLRLAHRLGERAAYSHVERLAAYGLVARIYDRDGSLVATTLAGRRAVRPDIFDGRLPRAGLVRNGQSAHARAVSWAAARSTLRGQEWVSDREMRSLREWQIPVIWSRRSAHRPDLGVTIGGNRLAIEMELMAKSPSRLRAILSGYYHQIVMQRPSGVVYVCADARVAGGVERAARRVGLSDRRLRMWMLDDFQRQTRELVTGPTCEPVRDVQGATG